MLCLRANLLGCSLKRITFPSSITANAIFKPRATKRTLIGAQLAQCSNLAGTLVRRPCDKVND